MPPLPRLRTLHLYSAPLSGCSARVKTALYLKRIPDTVPLTITDISMANAQDRSEEYLALNPNGSVPTLVADFEDSLDGTSRISSGIRSGTRSGTSENGPRRLTITQSPAILSFLEDFFPARPLLPPLSEHHARARALEIASLVACDVQPPQNSRIRRRIGEEFGGDGEVWARWVYRRGLGVVERLLSRGLSAGAGGGRYCVGDEVTVADVFLVPAVQGALRVGVDVLGTGDGGGGEWPLAKGVVERCWELEAFRKGGLRGHGRLVP
jgi:maleylacetoacetate isomerase